MCSSLWPLKSIKPIEIKEKSFMAAETYLKMKMKRIKREKKIATLSMVRSMTKSCRRRFGMNRTSLRIRSKRKVRKTDSPELPLAPSPPTNAWHNSTALKRKEKRRRKCVNVFRRSSSRQYHCCSSSAPVSFLSTSYAKEKAENKLLRFNDTTTAAWWRRNELTYRVCFSL